MRIYGFLILALACGIASASTIAYDYAPQSGGQAYSGALGMDFDVISPITVTALGVFDSNADGLFLPLTAYVYDRSTALALATVRFPAGNTGTLVDGERFLSLGTPLVLSAGFQGSIVAEGYGGQELNGNVATGFRPAALNTGGGSIAFTGTSRFGAAGSYPTTLDGGPANRYGAGTFQFTVDAASHAPEPSTSLLLGCGLLLLAAGSRPLCRKPR